MKRSYYLMNKIGKPLGWDPEYHNDEKMQKQFMKELNLTRYNDNTEYAFQDIIENLVLLKVISQELEQ